MPASIVELRGVQPNQPGQPAQGYLPGTTSSSAPTMQGGGRAPPLANTLPPLTPWNPRDQHKANSACS